MTKYNLTQLIATNLLASNELVLKINLNLIMEAEETCQDKTLVKQASRKEMAAVIHMT